MRTRRPDRAACRAVIAVAALYALALQAVLGGMVGIRGLDPAHVVCLQDPAGGSAPADAPAHHDAACCTAPQAAPLLAAPAPTGHALAWPPRAGLRVAWRSDGPAMPRGPPRPGAGARAPPTA